ncbi:hypothetical protein [Streptomyces goshikiensis]|uniref:hypothetical protein n=1 Tax=Streptomyces goshikiensis TaxID=1942 RepID=UPI0036BE2335
MAVEMTEHPAGPARESTEVVSVEPPMTPRQLQVKRGRAAAMGAVGLVFVLATIALARMDPSWADPLQVGLGAAAVYIALALAIRRWWS